MNRLLYLGGLAAIAFAAFLLATVVGTRGYSGVARLTAELDRAREQEERLLASAAETLQGDRSLTVPDYLVWKGSDTAEIELELQQTLLDIASLSRMTVLNFGTGRLDSNQPLAEMTYGLELEGGHEELVTLLNLIEDHEPQFSIAELWLRPYPRDPYDTVARLSVRLRLLVLTH
ncbi:hypothetical protein [Roseinatronobacter alkalisoli]|uniref:General secretion pathway protein GspM n=1 Tax=Roseinatronobacter alkalisoli TaxID=3028235 RepID=A0ABT5TF20_9RHOB|nr:hypothetical protein [Roseinatronobacter sp. HJB301]MDD7973710.1 hypothetical protein [Roseinatronobacter sp. HJB301]